MRPHLIREIEGRVVVVSIGVLYMLLEHSARKNETEDQPLWKRKAPVLVQGSDRKEQKIKWLLSLWIECGPISY